MLDVIEDDIYPITQRAVEKGNKIFGGAIIKKKNEQLLSFVYCYENLYSDYDVLYLIRYKLNCIYSEKISIKP